jgi:hypothetical protein
MERMFRSLGIRNGMMFMQSRVVDGECWVYDIGYRLTGSLEYINLKEMCGYDPLDMLIRFALTGDMGEPEISKKADPYFGGKYTYNVSLLCKPGKIAQIVGLEEVEKLPGVIRAVVAHPAGDEITPKMRGLLAQITELVNMTSFIYKIKQGKPQIIIECDILLRQNWRRIGKRRQYTIRIFFHRRGNSLFTTGRRCRKPAHFPQFFFQLVKNHCSSRL